MNAVIPAGFNGAVSTLFAGQSMENELGAGIQGGFGMIGYKGKVWSIRKGGEETPLMREDGDGPRASIEVVVVRASSVVSKMFYAKGYVEGSSEPPDCHSTNGVTPAAGAKTKQAAACAACPMNAWGSRITPAGKQGKACSDSKRIAVVPLGDLRNEAFGGPLLLRIPAASLTELANFGQKMQALNYPVGSYGMRIAFDVNESYPKFVFSAIRPLNDAEAKIILELRAGPEAARILAEDEHAATAQALPAAAPSPFEQPVAPQPQQGSVQSQPIVPQAALQTATQPLQAQPQPNPKVVAFPGTGVASSQPVQPVAATGAPVTHGSAANMDRASTQPQSVGSVGIANSEVASVSDNFDAKLDALLGG